MLFKPNSSSGVPIYLQLMEQVKHAVSTGALRPGEQLPPIRRVAEDLVVNPNTVVRAYRELEHDGIIELRQGTGAFVRQNNSTLGEAQRWREALPVIRQTIDRLRDAGFSEEEMRRLFESEFLRARQEQPEKTLARKEKL